MEKLERFFAKHDGREAEGKILSAIFGDHRAVNPEPLCAWK